MPAVACQTDRYRVVSHAWPGPPLTRSCLPAAALPCVPCHSPVIHSRHSTSPPRLTNTVSLATRFFHASTTSATSSPERTATTWQVERSYYAHPPSPVPAQSPHPSDPSRFRTARPHVFPTSKTVPEHSGTARGFATGRITEDRGHYVLTSIPTGSSIRLRPEARSV